MRGRRIPIALPNTGALARRKNTICKRAIVVGLIVLFVVLQVHILNSDSKDTPTAEVNDSAAAAAILSMVPPVFHKFLTTKRKNSTIGHNGTQTQNVDLQSNINISETVRMIARYNEMQTILNDDIFEPLQNDTVIIVVQVHTRITYLRHLIVSLAQARDISRTLLVFSHDYYDEDINELVQSIDFCKVIQIFYPYSIQTHPNEFPGADPSDCPRDIKKDQALERQCNNARYPDLYGHYREAKFTQTKHHWWWKANRVFDQLEVTKYHTGLVLFLEEDHYVAEDFLYLLDIMQKKGQELCAKCNILSLGTYLKTFNYYTYNNKKNSNKNSFTFGFSHSSVDHETDKNKINHENPNNKIIDNVPNNNDKDNYNTNLNHYAPKKKPLYLGVVGDGVAPNSVTEKYTTQWGYQLLPTLYSVYQKVEVTPWISSKHNMGMAFNRSTWRQVTGCAKHFCNYDDYNWDWSLQHVSQQCLKLKLHAMVVKGPRVFHIGECGVHHKKNNCESNQVISKVQKILSVARKSNQLFPKSIQLTVASVIKKTKLRKGNGGWGDQRDHLLCLNMTIPVR